MYFFLTSKKNFKFQKYHRFFENMAHPNKHKGVKIPFLSKNSSLKKILILTSKIAKNHILFQIQLMDKKCGLPQCDMNSWAGSLTVWWASFKHWSLLFFMSEKITHMSRFLLWEHLRKNVTFPFLQIKVSFVFLKKEVEQYYFVLVRDVVD